MCKSQHGKKAAEQNTLIELLELANLGIKKYPAVVPIIISGASLYCLIDGMNNNRINEGTAGLLAGFSLGVYGIIKYVLCRLESFLCNRIINPIIVPLFARCGIYPVEPKNTN